MDFDSFPARIVTPSDYLLAPPASTGRSRRRWKPYVRAENAFDADYQDVFGYRTRKDGPCGPSP